MHIRDHSIFKRALRPLQKIMPLQKIIDNFPDELFFSKGNITRGLIPNKIHFIWLGGPIPPVYLRSIALLAKAAKKSRFEITLWVNKQSNYVKTSVNEEINIPNLKIRNIHELDEKMINDEFYQDNKRKKFWEFIEREMVGFRNLSAASDFLRFEILRQEGGYYYDTDIIFNIDHTSSLKADYASYGVKTHMDINFNCKGNKIFINGIGDTNGDIIGILPNHPLLKMALNKMIEYHQEFDKKPFLKNKNFGKDASMMDAKRSPYQSTGFNYRREYTIEAGPNVWKSVLTNFLSYKTCDKYDYNSLRIYPENRFVSEASQKKEISGIKITTKCDNTWLKKQNKTEQKAFEAEALLSPRFF
jgi:hypothetical protein